MAFVHGKDTKVLIDEFDLSAYFDSAEVVAEGDAPETTTFGKTARCYVPGLQDGSISCTGKWDPSAGAIDAVLAPAVAGTAKVMTVGLNGLSHGGKAKLLSAIEIGYTVSAPVDDVVSVSMEAQADEGIGHGVVLHALTAESATGNDSSVDNTASSANGAVAHLHVTANTRDATVDVKVQHSTDNSVWVDLITFTQIAAGAETKQRSSVTGTVNRYLRSARTVAAGTGSITYCVAAARL